MYLTVCFLFADTHPRFNREYILWWAWLPYKLFSGRSRNDCKQRNGQGKDTICSNSFLKFDPPYNESPWCHSLDCKLNYSLKYIFLLIGQASSSSPGTELHTSQNGKCSLYTMPPKEISQVACTNEWIQRQRSVFEFDLGRTMTTDIRNDQIVNFSFNILSIIKGRRHNYLVHSEMHFMHINRWLAKRNKNYVVQLGWPDFFF